MRLSSAFLAALVLALPVPGAAQHTGHPPAPPSRPSATAADVAFMRGMLQHHAQAVEMTSLVPTRTTRPDLRALAERIAVGQDGEMRMMTAWLAKRGERPTDSAHTAHAGHAAGMPGMLSAAALDSMRTATGVDFERRFLAGMIRHHEGAIAMVAGLLATAGAAQDPQLFQFANDVDADQRAEIARMRRLLLALPK